MRAARPILSVSLLLISALLLSPWSAVCDEKFESKLEDSLLVLTNAERAKHELPPLTKHIPVARVARAHSLDMVKEGYFGHVNPQGLNVWERLNIAGIWYASCAENVGKTLTVTNANRGFMESESHRENILTEEYTHLGIGIFKGPDGLLYTTQNFIEIIDTVDVDSTARMIEIILNKKRTYRKHSYLRRDGSLDSMATAHSRKMLAKQEPGIPQSFAGIRTPARAFHYVTPKLDKVFSDKALVRCSGFKIGIGIVQGNSRKYGNGLMWITIIIVE
jgi:uncharacterized protein YkwD